MPRFETPEPITVTLDLTVTDVQVVAGQRSDTFVEVTPRDDGRRLDATAVQDTEVDYAGGRLRIKRQRRRRAWSPFGDGGATSVLIEVPAGSSLAGRIGVGSLRASGPLGGCRVRTGLGTVQIEQGEGVELSVGAGDIAVERAAGGTELSTGGGEVWAGRLVGTAVIKSSNGDVRVGEVDGELRVRCANGDIAVEACDGAVAAKTANGDILIAAARRGSVTAATGCGAVEVGVPHGTAAWLELSTGYGRLDNELGNSGAPEPGEERVQVQASSGFGNIVIRRRPAAVGLASPAV